LLNRKQRAARIQAEGRIEVLLGNLAQWHGFAHASARVQNVDPALFPLDYIEQAVEVVEIGRVAAHAGHVPANQLHGLIEHLLPPARDENVGTFFNEPLGARQRHAARSTGDDCNLTLKLSHDLSPIVVSDSVSVPDQISWLSPNRRPGPMGKRQGKSSAVYL